MAKYMGLYMGTVPEKPAEGARSDEGREMMARGMAAWGEWGERYKSVIVDAGGPMGKTRKVSSAGIAPFKNMLTGYVIVEADSLDAAAKIFEDHPHFTIFPGDSVEVVEIFDMPEM
ncbi:YciI family protein [Pelagibacterium xiamenense]|uniref:YciI family protein n=1 Tax=Pelagibacterium xiamenense TaxID=2901140 RepID=UPI001E53B9B8|nr:YciI family protein [Pelagibacterium xiamenense]MCD7060499.1 YciI family protein [Pelagibacterium xiamenense]